MSQENLHLLDNEFGAYRNRKKRKMVMEFDTIDLALSPKRCVFI